MSHDPILPSVRLVRDSEPDASSTIMGQFLIALRAKTTAEQSLASDDIVFTDEIIELVVLSGVEVLLHRISTQLNFPLTTRTRVLELAERLNRLLTFGLLSEYGDVQTAADAFWDQVVLLTRRAHALGYRPGMSFGFRPWQRLALGNEAAFVEAVVQSSPADPEGSLIDYWAAPAAMFFAPLVKQARTYRDTLEGAWDQLKRLSVRAEGPALYEGGLPIGDYLPRGVLAYLSETAPGPVQMPHGALNVHLWVDQMIRRTHVMRLFMTQHASWTKTDGSVFTDWIPTQILLAMIEAPIQMEMLPSPQEYSNALQSMRAYGEDRAVEVAVERLVRRIHPSQRITTAQRELLTQMVAEEVSRMFKWDPFLFDMAAMTSVMINSVESAVYMDPGLALSIAIGEEQAYFQAMSETPAVLEQWLASVGVSILWGELTREQIQEIIEADMLPLGSLVDGIGAAPLPMREELADALIQMHGASALNLLLKVGLRQVTVALLREYLDQLDPKVIADSLVTAWNLLTHVAEDSFIQAKDVVLLWKLIARALPSEARSFVQDPQYRTDLCRTGYEYLSDASIPVSEYMRLRTTLGVELYERLVTGILVLERDHHKRYLMESDESDGLDALSPWEASVSEHAPDVQLPYKVFGPSATRDSVREVLERIPEAQARDWAMIGVKKDT